MWPDRVSNPGPPTYESGALPIALRGPARSGTYRVTMLDQVHTELLCKIRYIPSYYLAWFVKKLFYNFIHNFHVCF